MFPVVLESKSFAVFKLRGRDLVLYLLADCLEVDSDRSCHVRQTYIPLAWNILNASDEHVELMFFS